MTVIDTPEGLEHFAMAQCIARLRIEVNTGMSFSRGSTLQAVQQRYGVKSKRKAGALKELEDMYEEKYGRRYGSQGE